MKYIAEENKRLKRMYVESQMQNDLLKEVLKKSDKTILLQSNSKMSCRTKENKVYAWLILHLTSVKQVIRNFTNEVQHSIWLLLWKELINSSRWKRDVRFPVFMKTGNRSRKS